jgi:hypothetical protein
MHCSCALSLIATDRLHFHTPHVHANDPEVARALQSLVVNGLPRLDAHASFKHVVEIRTPSSLEVRWSCHCWNDSRSSVR